MKSMGFIRYALAIGAASALLAACNGSQPPIGAPGAMPRSSASAAHPDRGGSWMLPEASSEDLVYATGGCGGICVLTYPDGKLKASIGLTYPVGGACSDSEGNVFVTNNAQVLEYAHGGTSPIASLALPGVNAGACGVDPKTGDLAVTFGGGSAGNIAIFSNATGTPTVYDAGQGAYFCGYDNKGDLFVSGRDNQINALAELPYGSSAFVPIMFNDDHGGPNQVQWDGKYITWESSGRETTTILRLSISGSTASVVGTTLIKSPKWLAQSWIEGDRVVVPYAAQGSITDKIGIWRYPKSGKAVVKFGNFGQSKQDRFIGITLSKP